MSNRPFLKTVSACSWPWAAPSLRTLPFHRIRLFLNRRVLLAMVSTGHGGLGQRLRRLCSPFPTKGSRSAAKGSLHAPSLWELELSWRVESSWQRRADFHHTESKGTTGFSAVLFSSSPAPVPGRVSNTWISALAVSCLYEWLFLSLW